MKKNHLTLSIYGIQDVDNKDYPTMIHDHNICLFQQGEIKKYLQLERYTRNKYDNQLPRYLEDILRKENLAGKDDLDLIFVDGVVGSAFLNERGNIRFESRLNDDLSNDLVEGMGYWFGKKVNAYSCPHELAHIYSSIPFFGMFKNNSLLIHFDGGASQSNFSAWFYDRGMLQQIEHHWDLDYLASFFNSNALTFSIIGAGPQDQNSLPGKLMGFSSYGNYKEDIEKWLKDNQYFQDIWGNKKLFFNKLLRDWGIQLRHFNQKNSFIQDIAATVQYIFQRDFIEYIRRLNNDVQANYLYYTGGSALNIKCNAALVEQQIFKEVFIPPCTNDSGLSIGAGALLEWTKHKRISQHSAYLNNWGLNTDQTRIVKSTTREAAKKIIEGKAVGVCNGYGETGPRALGNRSIIARADSKDLARYVSEELKGREWYRPLAPVLLEKNLEYFTGEKSNYSLARYMLTDFRIKPERQKEIEGVVHVDGTSRIQVIEERKQNPFMFDLLTYLDGKEGIKALINTSFNAKGRPIVHTEKEALKEAQEMGLEFVVLNGRLVSVNG